MIIFRICEVQIIKKCYTFPRLISLQSHVILTFRLTLVIGEVFTHVCHIANEMTPFTIFIICNFSSY